MRAAARLSALVTFLGGLAGCGYTEVHQVVLRTPTQSASGEVELYLADRNPPRPYYEIAMLQAIGHGADANLEDVTDALRSRARALGCQALVRVRVDQGYSMAHGFGICVAWATGAAAASMPPPVPAPTLSPPPVGPAVPEVAPEAPVSPPPTPAPVPTPPGRGPEEFGL